MREENKSSDEKRKKSQDWIENKQRMWREYETGRNEIEAVKESIQDPQKTPTPKSPFEAPKVGDIPEIDVPIKCDLRLPKVNDQLIVDSLKSPKPLSEMVVFPKKSPKSPVFPEKSPKSPVFPKISRIVL